MKLVQVDAYKGVRVVEGWDVLYADWLYRPRFVIQLRGDEIIDVADAYGLTRQVVLPTGVVIEVEQARITSGRIVSSQESITPLLVPDQTPSTDVLVLVHLATSVQGTPYWRSLSTVYLLRSGQSIVVTPHGVSTPVRVVNTNGTVVVRDAIAPTKGKKYNTFGLRRAPSREPASPPPPLPVTP